MAMVRKNLMVDEERVRELAQRQGVSASEAVRRAVDSALAHDALQHLLPMYEVEDQAAVSVYLRAYPFVEGLLHELRPEIERVFGTSASAKLDVVTEPKASGPGSETLFVTVIPNLPPLEAQARLSQLDEEWLLDAASRIQGRLNVTTGYAADAV